MKGYVYFVTRYGPYRVPELHRVKIGYCTSYSVESDLHNWYSRSMAPLCIMKVIPVGNARGAESMLHYGLTPYRLEPKHEIFDISSDAASNDVDENIQMLSRIQELSGLELPLIRPFDYDRWKLLREVTKAAKSMSKRLEKERETEAAEKERESQRLLRQERREISASNAEIAAEQKRVLKQAKRLEKIQIAESHVQAFFNANTCQNEDLKAHVDRAALFKLYEDDYKEQQLKKKTRVDKKRFLELMIDYFGEDCHLEKKWRKRDVFVGWTLTRE